MPLMELDDNTRSPGLRTWKKYSPEVGRRRSSHGGNKVPSRRASLGPISPNLSPNSPKPRKQMKRSMPPAATSMQMSLLKCQAAQAQMIIAHQKRKYQDAMDALVLAEDAPKSRTEQLAAEIAELQSRKEAALRGEARNRNSSSFAGDEYSDDDDEYDDDDETTVQLDSPALPRRASLALSTDPIPQAMPSNDSSLTPVFATSSTEICNKQSTPITEPIAKPIAQRKPWEITIAEPIVFDALMRHQDRAFVKFKELGPNSSSTQDTYDIPSPLHRPDLPQRNQIGVDERTSTFKAINSGLKTLAPYLFNFYSGEKPIISPNKTPNFDPYADLQVPLADNSTNHDLLIWDPHRIDSLETQLTSPLSARKIPH